MSGAPERTLYEAIEMDKLRAAAATRRRWKIWNEQRTREERLAPGLPFCTGPSKWRAFAPRVFPKSAGPAKTGPALFGTCPLKGDDAQRLQQYLRADEHQHHAADDLRLLFIARAEAVAHAHAGKGKDDVVMPMVAAEERISICKRRR